MHGTISHIIVMGVSGCGKSTLGKAIARETGHSFVEGDDLHSKANINKMKQGISLSDEDRHVWLQDISLTLEDAAERHETIIVSCSALKQSYRDVLIEAHAQLCFLWCHAPYEVLRRRLSARNNHFMPLSLLQSQYETLEPPSTDAHIHEDTRTRYYKVNVNQSIQSALTECLMYINTYLKIP